MRRQSGDIRLVPGCPVDFPEGEALRLLAKASGKVRVIDKVMIEPAAPNAQPIYWETGDARILGPGVPEFLMRDGDAFWISATFEQAIWWINADRLRSRKAFLAQLPLKEVEIIREDYR